MMRVLFTGSAGFIGSHALAYFAGKYPDWRYFVMDRLNYAASLDRLAWIRDSLLDEPQIRFVLHDFAAPIPDHLRDVLGNLDYVFHFGAETHVDRALANPEPFLRSNVVGTFNLLEYCRLHQPRLRRFFYVSTDEVYGPAAPGQEHTEEEPHRPSNPYSATKAAAEDLCYAWEHSMGLPILITNTMNNIG